MREKHQRARRGACRSEILSWLECEEPVLHAGRSAMRKMRLRRGLLWLVLFVAGVFVVGPSWAGGLYTFTDASGTIHFTDRPQDGRYRPVALPRGGVALGSNVRIARHELETLIRRVSLRHGMDPALVKAVIAAESNFEANAVSRAGAVGLMQLMPATAAELGVYAPFEPGENVSGGVRYLKKMLERFDVLDHALAAYNSGPETVDRYQGVPPYPETRAYVARVLRFYSKYQLAGRLAQREN